MKNKKIAICFTIILIMIIIGGYFLIKYTKEKNEGKIQNVGEYVPEEELTDEQARRTIVSLYFPAKDGKDVIPEARLVDIKEIINDPYDKLVKYLLEGPKNEKAKGVIPENAQVLKTYLEGDCVVIDFSAEILNYNKEEKNLFIKSLVNTLTELTEVNGVKILVDGNQNEEFKEIYTRQG